MALAQDYKKMIADEIYNIPEEYLPSVFQILQSIKEISGKKKKIIFPAERLLKLAGTLDNPGKLNARAYKKKLAFEHLEKR